MIPLRLLLPLLVVGGLLLLILVEPAASAVASSGSAPASSSSTKSSNSEVKRVNNLDYLDVETVQYYLNPDTKADYDVVILYYAQWCQNCHAFAPLFDQISKILKAGTADSKLIMGLFDCESSTAHAQVCHTASVTHYPTIQFISLSGEHLQRRKKPHHTTKFSGNWQYGDAVLDWITALSKLSQWHRAAWGKRIRNAVFGGLLVSSKKQRRSSKTEAEPLPLGVPATLQTQHELQNLQLERQEAQVLLERSNIFVDVLLSPRTVKSTTSDTTDSNTTTMVDSGDGKTYTDVYAWLHQQAPQAWSATAATPLQQVIRTCASEVALDYCHRVKTHYMEKWLEDIPLDTTITEEAYESFQAGLVEYMNATEPFCITLEECSATTVDFSGDVQCQPEQCPFADHMACRYLTACLHETLQNEYAVAMQLSLVDSNLQQEETAVPPPPKKKTGFSWGM